MAPNTREYYFDARFGCVRRVDLRGAGTRREQRIEGRKARNERKRELKRQR